MAIRDIHVDLAGGSADGTIRIVYSIKAGHEERTVELRHHRTKWGLVITGDTETIEVRHGDPIAAATSISAMWEEGQEEELFFQLQKDNVFTAGDLLPYSLAYIADKYGSSAATRIQDWMLSLGLTLETATPVFDLEIPEDEKPDQRTTPISKETLKRVEPTYLPEKHLDEMRKAGINTADDLTKWTFYDLADLVGISVASRANDWLETLGLKLRPRDPI